MIFSLKDKILLKNNKLQYLNKTQKSSKIKFQKLNKRRLNITAQLNNNNQMKISFSERISLTFNKKQITNKLTTERQNSQRPKHTINKFSITHKNNIYKNNYIHRLVETQNVQKQTNKSILKKQTAHKFKQNKKNIYENPIIDVESRNIVNPTKILNKGINFDNQIKTINNQSKISKSNTKIMNNQIKTNKSENINHSISLFEDQQFYQNVKINFKKESIFQDNLISNNKILKQNKQNIQNQTQINQTKQLTQPNKQANKRNYAKKHLVNLIKRPKSNSKNKKIENTEIITTKRFDITKLDFSFNLNINSKIAKDKEIQRQNYSSIIEKSRNNIKKIIQMNKLLQQHPKIDKMPKSSGQQDNIQILHKIKKGCFGTVYKGRFKDTCKLIAVKSIVQDKKYHQRQEQICKKLNNPFLVKIYYIYNSTFELFLSAQIREYHDQIQEKQTILKEKLLGQQKKPLQQKRSNFMRQKNISIQAVEDSFFKFKQAPSNVLSLRNGSQKKQSCNSSLMNNTFSSNLNDQLKREKLKKLNNLQSQSQNINPCIMLQNQQTSNVNNVCKNSPFKKFTNIVMDLYDCDLHDYIEMKKEIDPLSLKIFSYQMVRSLLYLHSNEICHRDVKPNNFLVKKHIVVLSDFGSAKMMNNHKNSNVSYICSRYYRAPELLLGYKYYDKSIDLWALGCTLAQLALGRPLFQGVSSIDQLIKIIRVLGEPNWRKISFMIEKIPKIPQIQHKGLKSMFSQRISPLFIDLLQKMLVFNPLHRISAGEALCHPFFDQLRQEMNFNQICKQMDIKHFLQFDRIQLKKSQHLKNKLIPLWTKKADKISKKQFTEVQSNTSY